MEWNVTAPMNLQEALKKIFPNSSINQIKSYYKNKRILVNGRRPNSLVESLFENDKLTILDKIIFLERGVDLLYSDRDIAVIDKPKGLLSVATDFETQLTAHAILKNYFYPKRVFPVHRLDQETSGLLIFALSEEAKEAMKNSFEAHNVDRRYVAIVEGYLKERSGTWRSYLYEDAGFFVHSSDDPREGDLAITHYRVKNEDRNLSWLEVQLETGKKNQIRVHCQRAGHPVFGDVKYGGSKKTSRLFLHAEALSFLHPITKRQMHFKSPVPEIFFDMMGG